MTEILGAQWPKWVYPEGTPGVGPAVLVQNEEEEARAMPAVAADAPPAPTAEEIEAERAELVDQAEALGIEVDKRWGVKRLRKAIHDHAG